MRGSFVTRRKKCCVYCASSFCFVRIDRNLEYAIASCSYTTFVKMVFLLGIEFSTGKKVIKLYGDLREGTRKNTTRWFIILIYSYVNALPILWQFVIFLVVVVVVFFFSFFPDNFFSFFRFILFYTKLLLRTCELNANELQLFMFVMRVWRV